MTIFATYPADGPTPAPRQRKKVINHKRHLDICWQKAESHRQTREGNDPLRREPRARASRSVCTRFPARCRSQVKWNTDDSPAGTIRILTCAQRQLCPGELGLRCPGTPGPVLPGTASQRRTGRSQAPVLQVAEASRCRVEPTGGAHQGARQQARAYLKPSKWWDSVSGTFSNKQFLLL